MTLPQALSGDAMRGPVVTSCRVNQHASPFRHLRHVNKHTLPDVPINILKAAAIHEPRGPAWD